MRRSTRIAAAIAAPIVFVLVLLAVVPLLFRDRIEERVKAEVNRRVTARVGWRSAGLSFFRHFPNLSLTLDDLTAVGIDRFQGDTLAAVRHLRVILDVASVLRNVVSGGPVVVRAVELDEPRLALVTLEDGTANWDIVKKPPTAPRQPEAARPVAVSLRHLEISDATIAFDDRRSKLRALLIGYDQSLSGDLSRSRVVIRTRAGADTATVVFAGIPYLNRVTLGLTADVQADLARKAFTLENTELRLNDLTLRLAGSARSVGKRLALDLTLGAPGTSFRSLLSLVPAIYAHDFDKVQTSGTIALDGRVQGEYGDGAFPSFTIDTKVTDAAFKYADHPLPARSIFVDLSLTNPGGSPDSTVARLDRFHLVVGRNPVDARMVLRTPVSDPDVDARIAGTVDLADIPRTLKLEGIEQLDGTVAANAAVRTRMSFIQKKQYDKVAASGTVDVRGLTVKGKALPHPLAIQQAALSLAPERAQLRSFAGTIGTSDIRASGTLENLLAFALRGDTLRGTATLRSNRFNLDEWRSGESDLQIIPVPPKIDFTLDAAIAELLYDKLRMTDARGRLRIANQRATLQDFRMNTLGGQIRVAGFYETTNPAKPTFDVDLTMTKVDIPSAFEAFTTVQMLAPVAKYASGTVSTDLHLSGALGKNMMPLFPGLSGSGTLETSVLALRNVPALEKVVEVTKLRFLDDPTLRPFKTAFRIQDGRLAVQPFDVALGGVTMRVAGSNGLDRSLQYTLDLRVPRSVLGGGAGDALASLASRAGRSGIDLSTASEIPVAIQLGGTLTSPTVKADVGRAVSSVASGVEGAAAKKASAEAARLVQEAETRAASIRQEARTLADKVKQEGYQRADSLVAKAGSNPLLQAAAKAAADRLRKEADDKAAAIVREADQRADSLVAAARQQAARIGERP
jgi:uncharacterized protein involved in outer membrane biogenesis